jgi:hypothetical protein
VSGEWRDEEKEIKRPDRVGSGADAQDKEKKENTTGLKTGHYKGRKKNGEVNSPLQEKEEWRRRTR